MNAQPADDPIIDRAVADETVAEGSPAAEQWAQIRPVAPQVAATIERYLARLATFLAPASVEAADGALRIFARWLVHDAGITSIAAVHRDDIEDFKVWLAHKPHPQRAGRTISPNTYRLRLRTVRSFFERIIEWDWPDAPARDPVINGDIPKKPDPLPRFLDDRDAAKFMAAARASRDSRYRLAVELLPAPVCAPASWCAWTPTPSYRSAATTGCASRWASCVTTATCRCTRNWSSCSPSGPLPTSTTSGPTIDWSPTGVARSTGTAWRASCIASGALLACPASTPTGSDTSSAPKRKCAELHLMHHSAGRAIACSLGSGDTRSRWWCEPAAATRR